MSAEELHPLDIEKELRRSLRNLTLSVIVLSLVTVMITGFAALYAFYDRASLRHEEERTTAAMCSFRADLKQRLDTNVAFVPRTSGTIRTALLLNIASEKRAYESLTVLKCKEGK